MSAAFILRINRGLSQNGIYRSGFPEWRLSGEKSAAIPNRSEKLISKMAVMLGVFGVALSVFCTQQLAEEPSLSSSCTRCIASKNK